MRLDGRPHPQTAWLIILLTFLLVVPALGLAQFRTSAASPSAYEQTPHYTNPESTFSPGVRTIAAESSDSSSQTAQSDIPISPVTYHGGPVQLTQYVYAIFWLPTGYHFEPSGNDSEFEVLISQYFHDVSYSNFSQILTQYPDNINGSPTNAVNFAGGFVDTSPYPHAGTIADPLLGSDITNEIERVINTGSLPTGVDDSYYVFTANGINVCEDQGMSLCTFSTAAQPSGFCAYHSFLQSTSNFPYALLSVDPSGISGGCQITPSQIGTSTFPYGDSIADSEISLASQEQFDMATDPLLSGWYNTANTTEVSNQCAGQFGLINSTTGSNIILNNDSYIIQEEWSNAAGGCTLSPPNYSSIQVILDPYGTSNSLSETNYYPLSYEIGRQLMTIQYVSGQVTIEADPYTSLTIGPMSVASNRGSEEWCLDASCQADIANLGNGSSSVVFSYYDMIIQNVYEGTSDNSQPTSFASLNYTTAPSTIGFGLPDVTETLNLTGTNNYIWAQRGSNASISSQTFTNGSERWINPGGTWVISQPFQIPVVISYHQYSVDFGFSTVPSGETGLTGPTVTYVSNGMTATAVAPQTVWADAGSSYTYGSQLGSSNGSERWISLAGSGAGRVTYATTADNTYYDQSPVTVSYTLAGQGGAHLIPPTFAGTSLGSGLTVTLTTSPSTYWFDTGSSYIVTNLLQGSNSTERWITSSSGTGTISAQSTLDFQYYQQFALNFSYTIIGGGTPPVPPVVNYSSLNTTSTYNLSGTPSSVWVNAGTTLSVSNTMTSASSTERWAYSSASETVSGSGQFQITLYHQYQADFTIVLNGGGSPTTPQIGAIQFGRPVFIQPTMIVSSSNSTNSTSTNSTSVSPPSYNATVWADAGTSYSLPSSLGNSSSERWATLSSTSGVVNSSLTVSVSYYNQYSIGLGYSVVNGADPSGGPSASVVVFGNTESLSVNQTSNQVWADAGTIVSMPTLLPGSNSGEQWITNSTVSANVTDSFSLDPSYSNEISLTLNSNPTSIPVAMSDQSGWYAAGSSQTVTLIAGRGWQFENWSGQGVGSYSGTSSILLVTLTSPVTETANFYTALTITTPGTGSVSYSFANTTGRVGSGQSKVVFVPPGQMLSMTASPFPVFYGFSSWTGNLTGGPNATSVAQNPLTFSVGSPASLNVAFKVNLIGIILVVVVVVIALSSVMLLRRRNRPQEEEYFEDESGGQSVENMEGEIT